MKNSIEEKLDGRSQPRPAIVQSSFWSIFEVNDEVMIKTFNFERNLNHYFEVERHDWNIAMSTTNKTKTHGFAVGSSSSMHSTCEMNDKVNVNLSNDREQEWMDDYDFF